MASLTAQLTALVFLIAVVSPTEVSLAEEPSSQSELTANDWLLSAPSDRERFESLQRQLRGFDQPMWEVGERFESMYHALERENFDLALYHWEKIGTTIRNGIAKRPARADNANAFFLGSTFETVRDSLAARQADKAWNAFTVAKAACEACHQAENVRFMNEQPLFDLMPPDKLNNTEGR
ncbi:MAG: hypothetical protein WD448_05750 [Woeseia sp.]